MNVRITMPVGAVTHGLDAHGRPFVELDERALLSIAGGFVLERFRALLEGVAAFAGDLAAAYGELPRFDGPPPVRPGVPEGARVLVMYGSDAFVDPEFAILEWCGRRFGWRELGRGRDAVGVVAHWRLAPEAWACEGSSGAGRV